MNSLWPDKRKTHYVLTLRGVEVLACAQGQSTSEKANVLKTRKWPKVTCVRCRGYMEEIKKLERR